MQLVRASRSSALRNINVFGRASRRGEFYSTSVMHGTYAFNQIRITFDTDVFVDFYDLHLNAIAPGPYSIPLSGFS